ncbi:MAG: hypothetical protein FD161_2997 [Limisphaerales bacterium]|nr:MAG: hypothetical protein FD161_2997 [Limisphaerales bacterium]KAG0508110.1 MAG: hypothetical protein E1N63_2704 [Limisphaerales bacterium]TXT53037.1 MAG: hypothetical protein FD140_145 [Limisphaerales bacterium]
MRKILLLLVAAMLTACKPSERVITGQVFIPTQGGANVKLGGVKVLAVPAALAQQREKETSAAYEHEIYLAEKATKDWQEESDRAKQLADKVYQAYRQSHMEVTRLQGELERLRTIASNNAAATLRIPVKSRETAVEANKKVIDAIRSIEMQLTEANKAATSATEARDKTAAEAARPAPADPMQILALAPRLARLQWPEAIGQVTTDADGKFLLRIKPGEVALVASGMRSVFDKTELYFWRVPVPTGEQAEVMLTGSNARVMTGSFTSSKKADAE